MTPHIKHWLPTREYKTVRDYLRRYGSLPTNCTVRLSALMVDGEPPIGLAKNLGVQVSGVSSLEKHTCPAPQQGDMCGECRECWNRDALNVGYKKHGDPRLVC